jgi:hypothetical protein
MSVIEVRKPAEVTVEVTRRDVLHRAADLLEEFGWTTGNEGMPSMQLKPRAPYCLLGSVAQARADFGGHVASGGYFDSARDFFGRSVRIDAVHEIVLWNDTPGRTKAEVVARLREAADAS